MKQIQVHCVNADGSKAIVNRFSGDNTEAHRNDALREKLLAKALKAAFDWGKVFPNDKFVVVEV